MKKYILGSVIVVVFVGYVIYQYVAGSSQTPVATTSNPDTTGTPVTTPTPTTSTSTPTTSSNTGAYKDGTYTGTVADAFYGKLQVVVTISNGSITNVTWPVYPNEAGHTLQVTNSALPQLKTETIAAQSAQVNTISGATQTSDAYKQSLTSALSQAQNS